MKVALIIDTWFPTVGGGQINALEISKRLAGKGMKIDIITRNTGADNLKLPPNLSIIKLGGKTKPSDPFSKSLFLIRSYLYILRKDYDLIHAHAFLPGITARLISITKGKPSIFTVHGTSIGTSLNNPAKEWLEKLILTGILYNCQITVSRDLLKLKNVNRKIYYIPNGVDVKEFDSVVATKSKNPTLIFVGRLHPQKNLQNLIKAISFVKKDTPKIKLLIIGDGQQKESLKNLAKDLGLTSNVLFKGQLQSKELVKLYKSSHIFILPSIYEGQPLTVLEAWASKLPVIVSSTGDLPYLVKEGYNGYLIGNPQDPEEIAFKIKKALLSKNLQSIGQNGYNLVVKTFSWKNSAQKTLEVYNEIARYHNSIFSIPS